MGGSRLAAACAARLPALDPETAFEALQTLATDGDRPVEARLAAIRQLPPLANEAVITALTALTDDPVQQVRAAALAAFAELAHEPDGPWADEEQAAVVADCEEAEVDIAAFPTSTLAAIEARMAESEPPAEDVTAENTPKPSPRKRRVAVDGSGDLIGGEAS